MHFGKTSIKSLLLKAPHLPVICALMTADACAVFIGLVPYGNLLVGILAHILTVAITTFYALFLTPKGNRQASLLIGTATVLISSLIPILGIFFMLGIALELFRASKLNTNLTRYVLMADMIDIGDEDFYTYGSEVNSIVDVMHGTDVIARRRATLGLRSLEPVFALPVLRKLIQDSDETVRLYALNLFRDIINTFEQRTRELLTLRDKSECEISDLLELAEYYREQVYVGLAIDDAQRHSMMQKAIKVLEEANHREQGNPDILLTLIKYTLADFDTARASIYIQELETIPRYLPILYPWRCELYFEQKDWEGLIKTITDYPDTQKTNKRLLSLRDFWLKKERVAKSE